jgi:Mg-chelatase subunit ChlD
MLKKLSIWLLFVLAGISLAMSTVLLFDASGSMGEYITAKNGSSVKKIDAAKDAAYYLLDQVKSGDEIALIVFYDCTNIKTEIGFTTNMQSIKDKIKTIKATSDTPIAGAIKFADNYISTSGKKGAGIIILTDGEETCSGDPVSAATNTTGSGTVSMINVVGFDVQKNSNTETKLKSIATAGKGNYYSAGDKTELGTALTSAYQSQQSQKSKEQQWLCCPSSMSLGLILLGSLFFTIKK